MVGFSKKTYNITRCDTSVEILLYLNKPSCTDIMGRINITNGKCVCMCVLLYAHMYV